MQFRFRTLLIVLAILPPLLGVAWIKYSEWKAEQVRQLDSNAGWIIEVRDYHMHAAPIAKEQQVSPLH
jgi:hypothetical protein